jgi:hypothetical protein
MSTCTRIHNGVEIQAGTGTGQYDLLILTTHPEYWSTQMYDNLKLFLDRGGSLIYLGGNGIFESTSFITAPLGGEALHFPGALGPDPDLALAYRVPYLFRVMNQVNGVPLRAERKLLGIAFYDLPADVQYVVRPHPTGGGTELAVFNSILQGVVSHSDTGVDRHIGTTGLIGKASGHEIDKLAIVDGSGNVTNQVQAGFPDPLLPGFVEKDTTPPGIVWLAEGLNGGADITFYRYPDPPGPEPGGGFVFSVGSINFGQSMLVDTRLKQVVKNVLGLPEPGLGLGLGMGVLLLRLGHGLRTERPWNGRSTRANAAAGGGPAERAVASGSRDQPAPTRSGGLSQPPGPTNRRRSELPRVDAATRRRRAA